MDWTIEPCPLISIQHCVSDLWEFCEEFVNLQELQIRVKQKGPNRFNLGGAWSDCFVFVRASFRSYNAPDVSDCDLSFRLVKLNHETWTMKLEEYNIQYARSNYPIKIFKGVEIRDIPPKSFRVIRGGRNKTQVQTSRFINFPFFRMNNYSLRIWKIPRSNAKL